MFKFISAVFLAIIIFGITSPLNAVANEGATHEGAAEHKDAHHGLGVKQPELDPSKAERPAMVKLLEPKALATVEGATVTLKWEKAANAGTYHVQVATDPRFKWLVKEDHFVSSESMTVDGLKSGQQYFWRVAAKRPENASTYTKGFFNSSSFEVK